MQHSPNAVARRFNLGFFARIPRTPGVYFMRAKDGAIIYVGKAKNLRARLLTYRYARWGTVGANIVALLKHVRKIEWELCPSEQVALVREREVIRALVPRYNIADAWEEEYFYIGLKVVSGTNQLHLRLTDREEVADGFKLYGCFRHRRLVRNAYSALLRIIAACASSSDRYSLPARICRKAPAYEYSFTIAGALKWRALIKSFLEGRNQKLLHALVQAMLENPLIPAYARHSLQADIIALQHFAEACPVVKGQRLSHQEMRESIRISVDEACERAA